jgi:hypothetical protein
VWILPATTADHTVDEHIVDPPHVYAHTPAIGSFQVTFVGRQDTFGSSNDTMGCCFYGVWSIGYGHN